jgi:hypothetical protein
MMDAELILFIGIGFVAQIIDGALGMASSETRPARFGG